MRKFVLSTAVGLAAMVVAASPALAVKPIETPKPDSPATCALTDITINAAACLGFYSGNLLNGSPTDVVAQQKALSSLGFNWDGKFNAVEKIDKLEGSHTVDFATLLQGISYVAFHFGNGNGGPGNATAFYRLDAGAGLDEITLAYNASSNAVLYSTGAVPEPASWAMMIGGFGVTGGMLRRRKVRTAVTYA